MRTIKLAFWGGLALLTLTWIAVDPGVFRAVGLWEWRGFMRQYTGIIAMGCMSVAMMLALRPLRPERWLGGLDKSYRLHKWLGIGALVVSVTHWLWIKAPKWAVGWGLITRPERGAKAPIENPIEAFFHDYRHAAEAVGEWAFYAAVALIVIALLSSIPYHWFRKSHRLLPLAYLALVFHTIILTKFDYWLTPLGAVLAFFLAGGTWAALVSLVGRIGASRRVQGTIAKLHRYPGVQALEGVIDMAPGWPGHKPGQFAFAMSNKSEGAHPYTIASAWRPEEPRITFITKALGDHTSRLADLLHEGQSVQIEGPYGCFTFEDDCRRQIWIGGGIGITPFIAKMKHLAQTEEARTEKTIDLFHSTAEVDEDALEMLTQTAADANVRLHLVITSRDGRLTGERIREAVPGWQEASMWFCGPAGFGTTLKKDFAAQGWPVEERFHQDLFQMR